MQELLQKSPAFIFGLYPALVMPGSHVLFPYFYKLGCPAGFERAIQGYAIHVLSITYQRLPRSILAEVGLSWLSLTFIVKRWPIIWKIESCFSSWYWVPHFCFVHLVRLPPGFMSVIVTQHLMLRPFVRKWWSCLGVLAILHFQGEEAELQCSFVTHDAVSCRAVLVIVARFTRETFLFLSCFSFSSSMRLFYVSPMTWSYSFHQHIHYMSTL